MLSASPPLASVSSTGFFSIPSTVIQNYTVIFWTCPLLGRRTPEETAPKSVPLALS